MEVQPNCAYIIPPNRDMAFLNGRCSCWSRPRRAASACRSTSSFARWPRTSTSGPLASCSRAPAATARWACGPSRARAAWSWPSAPTPPSSTACRAAPSPPAWWTTSCRRPRCRRSSSPTWPTPSASCPGPATRDPKTESALKKIFVLLRAQTGHDFSQYKPSTIHRRIERRMAVHQIDGARRLRQVSAADARRGGGPVSRPADRRDQFLPRSPSLCRRWNRSRSFPQLFAGKPPGDAVVRVWSPGCSTGEEAYSLAILLPSAWRR
jgi:two-component system CheB/CheR fusion protein